MDRFQLYKMEAALQTASRFALTACAQNEPADRAASIRHAIDFLTRAAEAAGYKLVSAEDVPDPSAALVETLTEVDHA